MEHELKIVEETHDGWKRLAVTFNVEITPRWWQFWKAKIKKQPFTASIWIKDGSSVYPTTLETTNTN